MEAAAAEGGGYPKYSSSRGKVAILVVVVVPTTHETRLKTTSLVLDLFLSISCELKKEGATKISNPRAAVLKAQKITNIACVKRSISQY